MAIMDLFSNVGFGDLVSLGVKGISSYLDYQQSRDQSRRLSELAPQVLAQASPYPNPDRQLAAQQLRGFMSGKLGPEALPNYRSHVDAMERRFAKSGKVFSSGAAHELAKSLEDEKLKYMGFLSNIAGAGFNPVSGTDLYAQILAAQQDVDRNRTSGFMDFLSQGADLFSKGKKVGDVLNFLNGGEGGISDLFGFKNPFGDFLGGGASAAAGGLGFGSPAAATLYGGGPMLTGSIGGLGALGTGAYGFGGIGAATAYGGGPMLGLAGGAGGLSAGLGAAMPGLAGIAAFKLATDALTSPGGFSGQFEGDPVIDPNTGKPMTELAGFTDGGGGFSFTPGFSSGAGKGETLFSGTPGRFSSNTPFRYGQNTLADGSSLFIPTTTDPSFGLGSNTQAFNIDPIGLGLHPGASQSTAFDELVARYSRPDEIISDDEGGQVTSHGLLAQVLGGDSTLMGDAAG